MKPYDQWHYPVSVHGDFYLLDLPSLEERAYFYLCAFCKKGYPISILIMAKTMRVCHKALRAAIERLISRQMVKRTQNKGRAYTYTITTRHITGWGQLPQGMGAVTPDPLGAVTPDPWGQLPPLTKNLDSEFLSLFHAHLSKWTFNRKPIGNFAFTRGMQTKALECMRWMHKSIDGMSSPEAFHRYLDACGEYLSLPRDVLSTNHVDQRALSPGKWLNDWPEQIRLAGIYSDEKAHKVTRIEEGLP